MRVMLPPGWARLATNPVSTGYARLWKTTGIFVVADLPPAPRAGAPPDLFGTIKAWMFVNKRSPPSGGMNASTVRLQHDEQGGFAVALGGVAFAGGLCKRKYGTRHQICAKTPDNRKGWRLPRWAMWLCSAKDAGPLSRQQFKPHTTILHHRSPLYEPRVSLI